MTEMYDKEGGHPNDGIGIVIFLVIFWAFALFMSSLGCSPEKKLKKAEDRVLNDPKATDRVGKEWEKTHPCVIDTVQEISYDTISQPIFIEGDCPPGVDSTVKVYVKGNERVITKTVTRTVEDTRRIYLIMSERDSQRTRAEKAETERDAYRNVIAGLTDEMRKQQKDSNKKLWKNRAYLGFPLLLLILVLIFKRRIPFINKII